MKSKIILINLILLIFSIKSDEVTNSIVEKYIKGQEEPKVFSVSPETKELALMIFSSSPLLEIYVKDPKFSEQSFWKKQQLLTPSDYELKNIDRKLEAQLYLAKLDEIKKLSESDIQELLDYLFYKYSIEHPENFEWDLQFALTHLVPKLNQDAYKVISKIYKKFSEDYPNATDLSYFTNLKHSFSPLTKIIYHLRNVLKMHIISNLVPQELNIMSQVEQGKLNPETKIFIKNKLYQIYNEFGPEFLNDLFITIIKEGVEEIKKTSYEMQIIIARMLLNIFNEFIKDYKIPAIYFKGPVEEFEEYLGQLKSSSVITLRNF